MQGRAVLDDRQAETGAAGHFAVALVHAVEALENTLLVGRGDADAGIRDADEGGAVAVRAGFDRHAAVRAVIREGVVRKVEHHLLERSALTGNGRVFARAFDLQTQTVGLALQTAADRAAERLKLDRLERDLLAAGVELRETDDVLDEREQTLRLGADLPGEGNDVGRLCDTCLDDLGVAHDARQRRFQLVRNVCGELLPLLFGLLALGDVNDEQHGGVACAVLSDRAGRERPDTAVFLHSRVRASAAERLLDRFDIGRVAAQRQIIAGGLILRKQLMDDIVREQNVAGGGEQHQTLVHACGDVVEFGLTAAQLIHLDADAAVLAVDAVQQGRKLVVCLVFQRIMQVERYDRREEYVCEAACEQRRHEQREQHDEHDPRGRARKGAEGTVGGRGNTQDVAVCETERIIIRLGLERFG